MYPWGYICLSEGVHLRLAIKEKNTFMYYLFLDIYTSNTSKYYFQTYLYA